MTSPSSIAHSPRQSVADGLRRSDSAWIVGGGPSLAAFDFHILRGQYVLACNDSFRRLPWADAVVSIDRQWIRNRRAELEAFDGRKYLCHRAGESLPEISNAVELSFCTEPGLSREWSTIHGCTTGYAALNIAMLLGARFIGLLGFDYTPNGHWHAGYEWPSTADGGCQRVRDVWKQWAMAYRSTQAALHECGVHVVNYNPLSAVDAFDRAPLSSVSRLIRGD